MLLDVRLPDIDGFTVATRLADECPAAAVVMMSSSDDPLYPELARQSRARGFLAKHDISGPALLRLPRLKGRGTTNRGVSRTPTTQAARTGTGWLRRQSPKGPAPAMETRT